jgi:hypothetical protein
MVMDGRILANLLESIPPLPSAQLYEQAHVELVATMAQQLVDLANESIRIANESANIKTRAARTGFARDKVAELRAISATYTFLSLTGIEAFDQAIESVERKTQELIDAAVISSRDSITGFRFEATPSFRTPLSTLLHHGDVWEGRGEMLSYPGGRWRPISKKFAELGFPGMDADIAALSRQSEIGEVNADQYITFITAVKLAAIGDGTIEERAERIDAVASSEQFRNYVDAVGGIREMIDRIFPKVVDALQFLPQLVRGDMLRIDLHTVAAIDASSDDYLLAIPGMGKERLRRLRIWCNAYRGDRRENRIEPTFVAELAGETW